MLNSIVRTMFVVIFLAITATTQPLTNRPMLGDVELGASVRTPVFQIKIWPNGFDRYRKNAVRGTTNWMNMNGFSGFVPEFQSIANDIPNLVVNIDSAYQDALNVWSSCYPSVVNLNSRSIVVTVEPVPFNVTGYPPDFYASGVVEGDKVRVVNVHIHSSGSFMQNYKVLATWEFNNYFMCKLIGCPQNQQQEIWAQHPCQ